MEGNELSGHAVNGVNSQLRIVAGHAKGAGGAPQHYRIEVGVPPRGAVDLHFHSGPAEEGANGLTHEAL